ncbi:hypothetical protein HPB50_002437 [Hyalomma asiaticum]|uniref:Uncharacterized protein n=1 Tax=Hyalomma asiaticum TaxID=266040 RepID=A0ACB7SB96_HYAAI|nr:hypothetical protein HPB50_002437 [Hyalomma asiaticum]
MATAPCSTDVFEHLDDAAREEAYRSAVSEAAALKTEVDQLRRELELLKMVPSKDHDAANDDDAPKPPLDPQLQASHDFLCNLLAPLIERIERLESRTRSAVRECTSAICRFVSNWLRFHIDATKDPCEDFYGYICETFRGLHQLAHVSLAVRYLNIRFLNESTVPPSNQVSWQKAAGLYKTCMSFVQSNRTEVGYSKEQDQWFEKRRPIPRVMNTNDYALIVRWYGIKPPRDIELASTIAGYEKTLEELTRNESVSVSEGTFLFIRNLAAYTMPYVTAKQWEKYFSKHTNNTYRGLDWVLAHSTALGIIVDLYKAKSVGEKGLRYLVAWSVYRQLVKYTVPYLLVGTTEASLACYELARKAMHLALMSPYLRTVVQPPVVDAVKEMLEKIRNAFRETFESSSWVKGEVKATALRKLANMKSYVGSPGRYQDPAYVEELYRPFPDVPPDRLFPSWIKALSLSTHQNWTDQKTWLYDEADVNAYYSPSSNAIVVPTGIITRPVYYYGGPPAINYGGLGSALAHEMMHAYDINGLRIDDNLQRRPWATWEFGQEYTNRTVCLRKSHREAIRPRAREEVLNHTVDSENLADIVGVNVAYRAFTSLPMSQRGLNLVGLNESAERLFFISHCVKWCAELSVLALQYAPFRSRCIVPLMNMPEFSRAFGCAAGQPMNPMTKCKFW